MWRKQGPDQEGGGTKFNLAGKLKFCRSCFRLPCAMPDAADDVHASAVAGGASRRPPPLEMTFSSGSGHSRRQSNMSSASSDSDDVEAYSALSALDSSAALILVHDQEEPVSPLDYSEEDELIDDDELVSPMFEVRRSAAFQSLSPSTVFLLLLAPFLKLGALNLPHTRLPLNYGLPALLLSALASIFSRQIWYMLARYVRKADMTDILLDTFAKGRGKERQRTIIRGVIRVCNGSINLLLAVTYLRCERFSVFVLLP